MNNTEINEYGKKILKALKPYAEINHKKAILQMSTSFLPFIGIFALSYYMFNINLWAFAALTVLNAFFIVRIFIIQHDCGHNTFVKNSKVRDVIGFFCSLFSAIPYRYWAKSHQFHHSHNGELDNRDIGDIDTLTVKEYESRSKWGQWRYRAYRFPAVLFILGPLYYLMVNNRFPFISIESFKPTKKSVTINNLVILSLLITFCLLLDWKVFLITYFVTLYLFYIIAIWFFFVQHQHEEGYKQWKQNWTFFVAAIKGSTYYKLPRLVHFLTGNIGIHHIHHLNSAIPSYNLQRAIKENPWFNNFTTQIGFFESLKLMHCTLWHEDLQRMISFNEYKRLKMAEVVA